MRSVSGRIESALKRGSVWALKDWLAIILIAAFCLVNALGVRPMVNLWKSLRLLSVIRSVSGRIETTGGQKGQQGDRKAWNQKDRLAME